MVSLNKVMAIGNVGTDPELRFTPSGKPVASFNIATNRNYNDANGERKEETEWMTIIVWNKQAEFCNQYLKKGRLVYVEGRLKTRSWEKDGVRHYKTEVIANQVTLLDRSKEVGEKSDKPVEKATSETADDEINPDEIPF